ncbi:hypothetical protein AAE478_009045 [Parahypoxylon ruwenzoriense]
MSSRSKIIRDNPIGDQLTAFRNSVRSICEPWDVDSPNALDHLLQGDIYRLSAAAIEGDLELHRIKPLLHAVLTNKSDEEIWDQVYRAVTEPTPPPRTIASSLLQTPSSRNMGSLVNSSEYRTDTDDVLKEDLGVMYADIPGFYEAFFGSVVDLERASRDIFDKCRKGPNPLFREGWTAWPSDASEHAVLSWLQDFVRQLARWAQGYRPTPTRGVVVQSSKPVRGSTAQRRLDIGIVNDPDTVRDGRRRWSKILIPGELKSSPGEDRPNGAWFHVGKYVREVFAAQATRRFVLAFTLCGPIMRVWEFDRLGGISSTPFDINENGLLLVSTILGFLWMEEKELGFDPTIITLNNEQYIEINREGAKERILIDEVMGRVPCIVGRATTCWRAHPEGQPSMTLVIKDSWQHHERGEEGEVFREVTRKGVRNVARYYYHETIRLADGRIDDIQGGIRKGLDITKASKHQLQHPGLLQGSNTLSISQNSITGQKRSSSQTNAPLPSSKRSRSEFPMQVDHATLPNRIHRRVIVSDYGQPIYMASSHAALLAALKGCIEGHESLHKAGILHRDISVNNLMVNKGDSNASWSSFLIDLDLAIPEDRKNATGAKGKTGTRAFMAIGALLGEQHSFMHDLESFFWVLFWICMHYYGPGKSEPAKRFESWNYMNMEVLAEQKMGIVLRESHFINVVTQYCMPYYEPLIQLLNDLRKIIFPYDKPWEREDETLYARIRETLQKEIESRDC